VDARAAAAAATSAAAQRLSDPHELARQITSESRFHETQLPRPLHGLLDAIGRLLDKLVHPFEATFGGPAWLWPVAALVLVVALAGVVRTARRRSDPGVHAPVKIESIEQTDDPAALERAADDAERRAQNQLALRLRFRAGLLRLQAADAIELRPGLTSGQIARRLGSERFRSLASTFDAVAYGGRDASPNDVDTARREWPRVLEEARGR
jgi:hypothetical protein